MHGIGLSPSGVDETDLARGLVEAFDRCEHFTIGVEEELLLVSPTGTDLVDGAAEVAARAGDDPRIRRELPPSQVEVATPPRHRTSEVAQDIRAARVALRGWCEGIARPVAAAVHPVATTFAGPPPAGRGRALVARYGTLARRQLVSSLQVHVAPGDSRTALGIHDALRDELPLLAALGAAAPFAEGHDTGMASVRPLVAGSLPRQGTPPPIVSWEGFARELDWGRRAGGLDDPTLWWWELRPHPRLGTLEVRVLDAQPSVEHSVALVELVVAVVRSLDEVVRAGRAPEPTPSWRIDENRWSAMLDGMEGTMADLRTGATVPTRVAVTRLIDRVEPWSEHGLDGARRLADDPHPARMRALGVEGTVEWLATADGGTSG